ncbi:MAG: hypothetical protein L7F78_05300 [Syntrophales bacterium LBB04]|nr:hypothetical protein [Syntrophales bacterium LBB04]
MEIIRSATDDEVYLQLLRSEQYRFASEVQNQIRPLLLQPDLNDILQNSRRRQLLYAIRHPLLSQLPDPMEWHLASLHRGDLARLHVIRNCGWDEFCPGNLLCSVRYPEGCSQETSKKIEQLRVCVTEASFDGTLILIGKESQDQLTVLDGNHRAVAMYLAAREGRFSEAGQSAFLGLSPRMHLCYWSACA